MAKIFEEKKPERRTSSLRKGDMVMVISGGNKNKRPNKGKVGRISKFVGTERVVVEGVNLFVKHQGATRPGVKSGVIQREAPVHVSNVMYYVEKLKRPVRLCQSISNDGIRVRGYRDPKSKEFVQI